MLRISIKYSMRITMFTELQNMDSKINLPHGKLKSVKTATDKIKLLPAK